MPVGTLLFSTQGRIGPRLFWRGVILLVAIQIAVNLLGLFIPESAAGIMAAFNVAYLGFLVVVYLGVYAKRLHDAGHTAWFFLLAMACGLIVTCIVMTIAVRMLVPEFWNTMVALLETQDEQRMQTLLNDLTLISQENAFVIFAISLTSMLVSNVVAGFFVARLKSDPGTNRFGPPNDISPTFD